jgi:flap endonuclease-1
LGVDLADIIPDQPTTLDNLSSKVLAVDAYNALYQFLAIIRQPDGTPLKDRQGRVTSHLSGLLYRTTNLAEKGIRLVFVFDGKPPELKEIEIRRRRIVKEEAIVRYERIRSGYWTRSEYLGFKLPPKEKPRQRSLPPAATYGP